MKKRKRLLCLLLSILMCVSLVCVMPASAAEGARVIFKASSPDSSGYFNVTMTMYDMTFRVYQFALKYDTSVAQPVDSSGKAATEFSQFAAMAPANTWLSTVGTQLNASTGLIDFSGYIMPGATGSVLNANYEAVAGSSGILIYTFRFKLLKTGDMALQLATQAKGQPYREACPDGVIIAGENGDVPASIVFDVPASLGKGSTTSYTGGTSTTPTTPTTPTKPTTDTTTVSGRLKGTVIMQIGNYAATVDGTLCHIDPDNKTVMPYATASQRTMVPIRFISEKLGATVTWDGKTKTITITQGSNVIKMTLGSKSYTLNGAKKTMDAAPEVMANYGRTFVPIRFVAEALGKDVEWDQTNKLVIIAPADAPWDVNGSVEKEATSGVLLVISPALRDMAK